MPIYEYRCGQCSGVTEHFLRSRSAPAPERCTRCGGGPLERLISRSAFHLKGEGWYTTDYKPSSAPASTSSSSSENAAVAATGASDGGGGAAKISGSDGGGSAPSSSGSQGAESAA